MCGFPFVPPEDINQDELKQISEFQRNNQNQVSKIEDKKDKMEEIKESNVNITENDFGSKMKERADQFCQHRKVACLQHPQWQHYKLEEIQVNLEQLVTIIQSLFSSSKTSIRTFKQPIY